MIAEIWAYGELILRVVIVAHAGNNIAYLDKGSSESDAYNAMRFVIDGEDKGCVHDYTASTKQVVYGNCADAVLRGMAPRLPP